MVENLNDERIDERFPNIRFLDFGRRLCFCVIDLVVYMFDSSFSDFSDLYMSTYRKRPSPSTRRVYSYKLPEDTRRSSNFAVEESMLVDALPLETHKLNPVAIPYGTAILVFSKTVLFSDKNEGLDYRTDFELYYPYKRSVPIPALSISRVSTEYSCSRCLYGYGFYWYEFVYSKNRSSRKESFRFLGPLGAFESFEITGYGIVDEHTFVVQTDLLQQFSLDLKSPSDGWRTYTGGWIAECEGQFFGVGKELCLDEGGASDMKLASKSRMFQVWSNSVADKLDEEVMSFITELSLCETCYPCFMSHVGRLERRICLPLSSFNDILSYSCGVAYLGDPSAPVVCYVRLGVDEQDYPHMIVDQFELDSSRFPLTTDDSKFPLKPGVSKFRMDAEEMGWAKRTGSLKFAINDEGWESPMKEKYCIDLLNVFPIQVDFIYMCFTDLFSF